MARRRGHARAGRPRPTSASTRCCSSGWRARAATRRSAARSRSRATARVGTLVVARDRDEAEALDRLAEFRRGLGLPVERLRPSQARRLEPALAPTIRLALDIASDHSVDPRKLVAALRAQGHAHLRRAPARPALQVEGERVTGVITPEGTVLADQVVVAAGVDVARLDMPEHARVPVRPVKGQVLRLRDPNGPGLVERTIRGEQAYFVPRGDGRYVLGATMEERGWDTHADRRRRLRAAARPLRARPRRLRARDRGADRRPAAGDARQPARDRPGRARRARLGDGPLPQRDPAHARHRRPRRGRARRRAAAGLGRARRPAALRRSAPHERRAQRRDRASCATARRSRPRSRRSTCPARAAASRSPSTPRSSRAANGARPTLHEGARVEILRAIQGG